MNYLCRLGMASKYGKWLGGAVGWAFGGPIGALVGFSLGMLWDNATLLPQSQGFESDTNTHPGDFIISLLVLLAAVMKADNRLLKSELNYIKSFLVKQYGQDKTEQLLPVLKDLLSRDIALQPICNQIRLNMTHAQRLELVHLIIGLAMADGEFHEGERRVISYIAHHLNISSKDMDSLIAMYEINNDRYYRILEIEKGASQEEIKSAYRKMAKKYHPDKLGDVGEDVKKAAIEKFRLVQEAYDVLNKNK